MTGPQLVSDDPNWKAEAPKPEAPKTGTAMSAAYPGSAVSPEYVERTGGYPSTGAGESGSHAGEHWHSVMGDERHREDNSVAGLPPELAALSALAVGAAMAKPAATVATKAKAIAGALGAQVSPVIKYEVIKHTLTGLGVSPYIAMPIAMAVSGWKSGGKAAEAEAGATAIPEGIGRSKAGPTPLEYTRSLKPTGAALEKAKAEAFASAGPPPKAAAAEAAPRDALLNAPKAAEVVDGRRVREGVPNLHSIDASLTKWEELPGVRDVPMSAFDPAYKAKPYSVSEAARLDKLTAEIKANKEISPLIVVVDKEAYPYILEGGHRFDALRNLGAKSFPAVVVKDTESLGAAAAKAAPADLPRTAATLSPAMIRNQIGIAARRAGLTKPGTALSDADDAILTEAVKGGLTPAEAVANLPALKLAKSPGFMTEQQTAAEIAGRKGNRSPNR